MTTDMLPPFSELSRGGWQSFYRQDDPWTNADRTRGRLSVGTRYIDFVRYNRACNMTRPVIINHGGPIGNVNDGWRYLFTPLQSNITFPYQYSALMRQASIRGKILENGLDSIVENIQSLHKSMLCGRALVVGSSWGGTVSLAYASMYPDLVSGVIASSPFLPLSRSVERILSIDGGFNQNGLLYQFFMENIDVSIVEEPKDIFAQHYKNLCESGDQAENVKRIAALFYSVFGDVGTSIRPDQIPANALSRERAMAFCSLAGQKKPFKIDENVFLRGLRRLKERSIPVHIIRCEDDRSIDENDIELIEHHCAAHIHKVEGGHSSVAAKRKIGQIIENL